MTLLTSSGPPGGRLLDLAIEVEQIEERNRTLTLQLRRLADVNAKLYRRGYLAGYAAAKRGRPSMSAGGNRTGRPREHEAVR